MRIIVLRESGMRVLGERGLRGRDSGVDENKEKLVVIYVMKSETNHHLAVSWEKGTQGA